MFHPILWKSVPISMNFKCVVYLPYPKSPHYYKLSSDSKGFIMNNRTPFYLYGPEAISETGPETKYYSKRCSYCSYLTDIIKCKLTLTKCLINPMPRLLSLDALCPYPLIFTSGALLNNDKAFFLGFLSHKKPIREPFTF